MPVKDREVDWHAVRGSVHTVKLWFQLLERALTTGERREAIERLILAAENGEQFAAEYVRRCGKGGA